MKREKFLMQLNMGHSKMITTSKEDYLQIWNAIDDIASIIEAD